MSVPTATRSGLMEPSTFGPTERPTTPFGLRGDRKRAKSAGSDTDVTVKFSVAVREGVAANCCLTASPCVLETITVGSVAAPALKKPGRLCVGSLLLVISLVGEP